MWRRTVMRLFALAMIGLVAGGLISASPASASCSTPSMIFTPHDVDRGGEVSVTGTGWGDNCYDTGPPPDGEGVLGRPVQDIDIVVVQGEEEWVVATVDAGDHYGFGTQVVVPQDAAPGDALLLARTSGGFRASNSDPTLRISAAPAITSPPDRASTPSPSTPESAATTSEGVQDEPERETVAPWLVVAATGAAIATGAWAVVSRLRSTKRHPRC